MRMCKNERIFDDTIVLKDNAMLKVKPELFNEWDFEKNDEFGLDVYKVTKGSHKVAWWNCPDCGSSYDTVIKERAGNSKRKGRNCPYCSGKRINHTNSLVALFPNLVVEWHPTLNGDLTPDDRTCGSQDKVWWLGDCGHEWDAVIKNRSHLQSGCPVCSNNIVLVGFNDMWTTNPELASQLLNPNDGYRYMRGSTERVHWKCLECCVTIKNKVVYSVYHRGLSCPRCSDGISFPEKFMYNLLREANIDFEYDTPQEWTGLLRYDFYLPKLNWIIEVHGGQHYGRGFLRMGERARTLEEEQENDRIKENLAKENGIDKYIVIDARESTIEWLQNSILDSDIMRVTEDVDFEEVGRLSSTSFIKEACTLWREGIHKTSKIADITKMSQQTIIKYLKRGAEIGWCDYSVELARKCGEKARSRGIIQLTANQTLIKEWDSIVEATMFIGLKSPSSIAIACREKQRTAKGFKWMYKEDYDKLIDPNSTDPQAKVQ